MFCYTRTCHGEAMETSRNSHPTRPEPSTLDYLLYALAATVIATVGFSFLLWLRY